MTLILEPVTPIRCASCQIVFGITAAFERARRDDGNLFFCPQGHEQYYPHDTLEKRNQRLQAELDAQRIRAQAAEAEARNATTHARRETTRRRNLEAAIGAGLCPKCRRSFKNVRRHMEGKHPELC